MKPPTIEKELTDLSQDPKTRHEEMVEIFGLYYFWLRSTAHERTHQLITSPEARERLSNAFRAPYEQIATAFSEEQKKAAMELADAAVDEFARLLLSMFSATGISHRIGKNHAIRFRLELEVCRVDDGGIVMQETVNRGGQKHFADYWGKWLLSQSKRTLDAEASKMASDTARMPQS